MASQAARRMFTTDEYHRMAEAGILTEEDRVELIEGEIVRMSPIGSRHAASTDRLTALFSRRLGRRAIVRVQSPIELDHHSEPQPDLAILKPRADFYAGHHPRPRDVLLLVEVVDASTRHERGWKVALYARAGIVEVWVVDLTRGTIEICQRPAKGTYRIRAVVARGRRVSAAAFPRVAFRVREILG